MARGITESDVHNAADALVASGERPTVERIRAHLGTGSPNTVTRWLETWWNKLGERLQTHQAQLSVPDAPDAVVTLAGEWWSLALQSAQACAIQQLGAEQASLHRDQLELEQSREAWNAEAAALQAQVQSSLQAERVAMTRATQLQYRLDQLQAHFEALTQERDAALARAAQLEVTLRSAEEHLRAQDAAGHAERIATTHHIRAVEDRAGHEIDRARQETKDLQQRIAALNREHAAALLESQRAAQQSASKAADALKASEVQRARAEALEGQLAKALDVPAALEAALRSGATNGRKTPRRTISTRKQKS